MESRQFPLPFPYIFLCEGSISRSTQVLWITIKKEVCVTLYAFLAVFDNGVGEVWGQRELHCGILS